MDDTLTLALWQCPYAGSPSQALVLLAFARLDNAEHKGLQRCREQMERIRIDIYLRDNIP